MELVVSGGYLGKFDGFPDLPASELDRIEPPLPPPCSTPPCYVPFGGLLSLRDWLERHKASRDVPRWLIVSGNNRGNAAPELRFEDRPDAPRAAPTVAATQAKATARQRADISFWGTLKALEPAIVALGGDDFLRSLSATGLSMADDPAQTGEAFLDWVRTGAHRAVPLLASNAIVRETTNGTESTSPLTRWPSIASTGTPPAACEALKTAAGLPFALFDRQGKPLDPATIGSGTSPVQAVAIAAFVDPDTTSRLGTERHSWTVHEGTPLTSRTKTIELLDPSDAMKCLKAEIPVTIAPLWIVVADLTDAQTTKLVNEHADIRVLVLPPGSQLLGMQTPEVPPQYSGDSGQFGVVDPQQPAFTRLLVRPEWIGESILTATLKATLSGARWALSDIAAQPTAVHGYGVEAVLENAERARYTAVSPDMPPKKVDLGVSTLFPQPLPGSCDAEFPTVWTERNGFRALVADAVRRSMRADIAVLSESDLELDMIDWLQTVSAGSIEPWRSGRIVDEVVFRGRRFARVIVPGSDLVKKMKAIRDKTTRPHVVGLTDLSGHDWTTEAGDKETLVNTRHILANSFYTIAVPVHVARDAEFKVKDEDTQYAFDMVFDRLRSAAKQRHNKDDKNLAECLSSARSRLFQSYFNLEKLSFGFNRTTIAEPAGFQPVLATLPTPVAGAKEQVAWSLGAKLDMVWLDSRHWAVRTQVESDLKQTRLRTALPSADTDESRIGLRGDFKQRTAWGTLRLFLGGSFERQVFEREFEITPERTEMITRASGEVVEAKVKGPKLRGTIKPGSFSSGDGGIELEGVVTRPSLKITALGLRYQVGQAKLPTGAALGGVPLTGSALTSGGITAALNALYQENAASIVEGAELLVDLGYRSQKRLQLDAVGSHTLPFKLRTKDITVDWDTRWRRYNIGTDGADSPRPVSIKDSLRLQIKLKLPIAQRVSIAPTYDGTRIGVEARKGAAWVHQFGITVDLPFFWKIRPMTFVSW